MKAKRRRLTAAQRRKHQKARLLRELEALSFDMVRLLGDVARELRKAGAR